MHIPKTATREIFGTNKITTFCCQIEGSIVQERFAKSGRRESWNDMQNSVFDVA